MRKSILYLVESRIDRISTLVGIGALIASFIGYGCYHGLPGKQAQWRIPLAM